VLDVDSNLPMWVQEKIQAVLEKYDSAEPRERAERVTQALRELGIGGSIAEYRHRNK
jgi:hypothetical protein